MVYDFSRLGFGCIRNPNRRKSFGEAPASVLVGAKPIPDSWFRTGWPIVLGHNDTLGTCVPTAACNAVLAVAWAKGHKITIANSLPVELYSSVGPYRGTPQTDVGMDPLVLFKWWRQNAIAGYLLRQWQDVDPKDSAAVRRAIVSGQSIFAVQEICQPQETQEVWKPAGGAVVGLHATSYNRFDGGLIWSACWGKEQAANEKFFSGPFAQVLDTYALDLVLAPRVVWG